MLPQSRSLGMVTAGEGWWGIVSDYVKIKVVWACKTCTTWHQFIATETIKTAMGGVTLADSGEWRLRLERRRSGQAEIPPDLNQSQKAALE